MAQGCFGKHRVCKIQSVDALCGAGALDVVVRDSSQGVRNPGREDVCTTTMHVPYNPLERRSVLLA